MPVPQEYVQASRDFDRFMLAARDALGHATTHQAYYSVLAVLLAFRRRLGVRDALLFADVLPPVLRAIFVSEWNPDQPIRPFEDRTALTREAQDFRRDHSFTPDDAIEVVASVLHEHIDTAALERVLARLPEGARDFWAASPSGRP